MSTILITYNSPQRLTAGEMWTATATEPAPLAKPSPAFASSPLCTIEDIQLRSEMMTDVLEGILAIHPEPRWGINE